MSQLQVTGEAKIRDIQGPVVANSGVITALDGAASQYVRGDGTLADFPTSSGGGSSVSYYLNSSVSQGTIGGVAYRELSKDPIIGAGTDITISANGYVANYITDANDPDVTIVPGGNFNCEFYFSVNNNTGNPTTYAELYKYDGTTFTLLGTSAGVPESINQGTTIAPYYFAIPVATAPLSVTDRLAIRIYVSVDGRTVTLHTENGHLCQVVTTLSKGMVSLNNLTDQSQYLTTGTSGTNFNIVSSGDTHTFNLPVASATNTGKLSSTDWSTFNNKVPYTGATANVDLGIWDLDAASLFSNGLGVYIKKNVSGIANSVDYVALSSSTYKLNVAEASSGSNAKIFNFDFSTLSDTTLSVNNTRTYTLPDASGTLALTSNLSAYVPYTGATSAVNLGTNNLIAKNTLADGLLINQSGSGSVVAGYTTIRHQTGSGIFGFLIDNSNTGVSAQLLFNNATSYEYTFPNASGTIALTSNLSSYVPYTGATANVDLGGFSLYLNNGQAVFGRNFTGTTAYALIGVNPSNKVSIDNSALGTVFGGSLTGQTYIANGIGTQGGTIALKQNGLLSASTGYTTLGALSAGQLVIYFGDTNAYAATFLNTSLTDSRSYTLPNANGTIALTSDLSGYVTLATTQTITANKTFSEFGFFDKGVLIKQGNYPASSGYNGIGALSGGFYFGMGQTSVHSLNFSTSNSYNYTFPNATGTIALTSNLSDYLPLTGGTLTGALSGTTATFSGLGTFYQLTMTGATAGRIFYAQTGGVVSQSGNLNWNETNGMLGVGTPNPTAVITAFSTNAATQFKAAGTAPAFTFSESLTTSTYACVFGLATSANHFITGTAAGDMAIANQSTVAGAIVFGTGTTERMRMSSSGNFGIGTGNPLSKLHVNTGTNQNFRVRPGTDVGATNGVAINSRTDDDGSLQQLTLRASDVIMLTSGNVGIGTSSPSELLHLYQSGTVYQIIQTVSGGSGTVYRRSNSATPDWTIGHGAASANENFEVYTSGTGAFTWTMNGGERMRITSNGTIGLNGSADVANVNDKFSLGYFNSNYGWLQTWSSTPLYLNKLGNAVYAGSVRLDTLSDERVKDNIQPIENALSKVLSITGKKFHLKDEDESKIRYGFIAQELEGVLDEFVIQTDITFKHKELVVENVKSIENWASSWAALLVEAMKEQQAQIESQDAKIEELKALIIAK